MVSEVSTSFLIVTAARVREWRPQQRVRAEMGELKCKPAPKAAGIASPLLDLPLPKCAVAAVPV